MSEIIITIDEHTEGAITEAEALVIQEAEAVIKAEAKAIQEAKDYLTNTDWYVIRQIETGKEIPIEIKELRELAKIKLSGGA